MLPGKGAWGVWGGGAASGWAAPSDALDASCPIACPIAAPQYAP